MKSDEAAALGQGGIPHGGFFKPASRTEFRSATRMKAADRTDYACLGKAPSMQIA
jgi:hypothetical protein